NSGVEKLKSLRQLRALDLRYTRATGTGVSALRSALPDCRIDFLDASGPGAPRRALSSPKDIQAMGGTARMESGKIREGSLASTRASDADLTYLAALPTLQKLDLSSTEVGDLGLAKLTTACAVTDLNLANTTVSDASLAAIARCHNLRKLNLAQ